LAGIVITATDADHVWTNGNLAVQRLDLLVLSPNPAQQVVPDVKRAVLLALRAQVVIRRHEVHVNLDVPLGGAEQDIPRRSGGLQGLGDLVPNACIRTNDHVPRPSAVPQVFPDHSL
jgi:hypothetical protein